jgi:hypothetical protein
MPRSHGREVCEPRNGNTVQQSSFFLPELPVAQNSGSHRSPPAHACLAPCVTTEEICHAAVLARFAEERGKVGGFAYDAALVGVASLDAAKWTRKKRACGETRSISEFPRLFRILLTVDARQGGGLHTTLFMSAKLWQTSLKSMAREWRLCHLLARLGYFSAHHSAILWFRSDE